MKYLETTDWYGAASPYRPEMSVEIQGESLIYLFRCRKAPFCDESLALGSFVEGLWEQDVAEFFVAGPGSSYQEVNISPTGAWWSCLFSNYRERLEVCRFEPKIEVSRDSESWSVRFEVALSALNPWVGIEPDARRFSACSILHDPEPSYFAWNHQGGGEPDFHRADLLQPFQKTL